MPSLDAMRRGTCPCPLSSSDCLHCLQGERKARNRSEPLWTCKKNHGSCGSASTFQSDHLIKSLKKVFGTSSWLGQPFGTPMAHNHKQPLCSLVAFALGGQEEFVLSGARSLQKRPALGASPFSCLFATRRPFKSPVTRRDGPRLSRRPKRTSWATSRGAFLPSLSGSAAFGWLNSMAGHVKT